MFFPLTRFWTYSPHGYFAAVIWNCSELIGCPCPFAPPRWGWLRTPPNNPVVIPD